MTQEQIGQIARQQSAIDLNCEADDFLKAENIVVLSRKNDRARKYMELPFYCAAWWNMSSVRNAIRSGFRSAWVELTAKPIKFVDRANGKAEGL